jgi:hypothetical protein
MDRPPAIRRAVFAAPREEKPMARRNTAKIRKGPPAAPKPENDATPERLAKEEHALVPAAIGSAGERRGVARKFRSTHLDRLHQAGKLSYPQWYAGNVYRETHGRCGQPVRLITNYGEPVRGGTHPGTFGYGLAGQESQARAREALRRMGAEWPGPMQEMMDALLVRDEMPRLSGRAAMRNMAQIREGLDVLARYLRLA